MAFAMWFSGGLSSTKNPPGTLARCSRQSPLAGQTKFLRYHYVVAAVQAAARRLADFDFDRFGLRFLAFRNVNFQHAVFKVRTDLVGGARVGQCEAACK